MNNNHRACKSTLACDGTGRNDGLREWVVKRKKEQLKAFKISKMDGQ